MQTISSQTDYTISNDHPTPSSGTSKKAYSLRETLQLYSEQHSRKRMISDTQFSPYFPGRLLASDTKNPSALNEPTGLILLWNTHALSRLEYTFNAGTDVLSARFSLFVLSLFSSLATSGQHVGHGTHLGGAAFGAMSYYVGPRLWAWLRGPEMKDFLLGKKLE